MARLVVNVPEHHFTDEKMGGRGRMWSEVLPRLAQHCELRPSAGERAARRGRRNRSRPDAWLFDGHLGPLAVDEPQVIQLHEAPWSEPESMHTFDAAFIEMVVEPSRRAARAAAAIICPSHSAKRQIVEDGDLDPEKVFVAHHGVDHDVFRPGVTGGPSTVQRFGGRPDVPYVMTVASVHPRKNLQALRGAVTELAAAGFPHQLVIVGGPAHGRSDWKELTDAAFAELDGAPGRVVPIPMGLSDAELAGLMCGADAFCLPSLSEGFGLPAAEAMACEVPAVLSDRGALTEVGGDAAVMVEPTTEAIAAGLRSLLVDPAGAKAIGKAGGVRAESFSWDRCAALWYGAITAAVMAQATT